MGNRGSMSAALKDLMGGVDTGQELRVRGRLKLGGDFRFVFLPLWGEFYFYLLSQ